MFISFREDVLEPPAQQEYGTLRRVIFTAKKTMPNSLPSKQDREQFMVYEDTLLDQLKQKSVDVAFVARITRAQKVELVFQVNDVPAFDLAVNACFASIQNHVHEVIDGQGWEFFNENIAPQEQDRMQMMDRELIMGMIKSGSNVQKPHVVDHGFRGPKNALAEIKSALEKEGFSQTNSGDGTITMSREQMLDLDEVHFVSVDRRAMAQSKKGVEYTGWGAAIVR